MRMYNKNKNLKMKLGNLFQYFSIFYDRMRELEFEMRNAFEKKNS